ncbi:hypothetical protein DL767_001169 [Monosporascus sp. MG133]|nr:hypothetical protein DL767_001169 [Monosporascus sp. MG133]
MKGTDRSLVATLIPETRCVAAFLPIHGRVLLWSGLARFVTYFCKTLIPSTTAESAVTTTKPFHVRRTLSPQQQRLPIHPPIRQAPPSSTPSSSSPSFWGVAAGAGGPVVPSGLIYRVRAGFPVIDERAAPGGRAPASLPISAVTGIRTKTRRALAPCPASGAHAPDRADTQNYGGAGAGAVRDEERRSAYTARRLTLLVSFPVYGHTC